MKLADVEERVNRARAMNRKRDTKRKLGDSTYSAEYCDGYGDALDDLHDALAGWCAEPVNITHWVEAS